MKYRNAKTGAVIDTVCAIAGGNWEPVEVPVVPSAPQGGKKPVKASRKNAPRKDGK